jgi:hypothetical protein
MIVPSDDDYVETKLVKLGKSSLSPVLKDVANWIEEYYGGVAVLNVCYDKVGATSKLVLPRLSVIFEWENDRKRFLTPDAKFDPAKQAKISTRFRETLARRNDNSFDTHRLFVIFCAFEPVARIEANWRVTEEQLDQMFRTLNCPAIWKIRPSWDEAVFFFHTDAQLKASVGSGIRQTCTDAYAGVLSEYDEFGYFRQKPIAVQFDSKENFETSYGGNWFNYNRR